MAGAEDLLASVISSGLNADWLLPELSHFHTSTGNKMSSAVHLCGDKSKLVTHVRTKAVLLHGQLSFLNE